jgi:hypothetical protein
LEDVVARRILGNIKCIFVEIFVNIPSIQNIPEMPVFGTYIKLKIFTKAPDVKPKLK